MDTNNNTAVDPQEEDTEILDWSEIKNLGIDHAPAEFAGEQAHAQGEAHAN